MPLPGAAFPEGPSLEGSQPHHVFPNKFILFIALIPLINLLAYLFIT